MFLWKSRQVHGRRSQGNGLMTSNAPQWVHWRCSLSRNTLSACIEHQLIASCSWSSGTSSHLTHFLSTPKCPESDYLNANRAKWIIIPLSIFVFGYHVDLKPSLDLKLSLARWDEVFFLRWSGTEAKIRHTPSYPPFIVLNDCPRCSKNNKRNKVSHSQLH